MRYVIAALAAIGIAVSSFALAAHYGPRADTTNLLDETWNSAYVSQCSYSEVYGVPVAVLGIVGYALVGLFALQRRIVLNVYASGIGLAYALYLTNVEARDLQVWSVTAVISLVVMVLITILSFGAFLYGGKPTTIQ